VLGKGGFGVVYKVRYLLDDSLYAIKKIKLHLGVNEPFQKHKVYREIQAISKLEPKNIIRYYTCWVEALDAKEQEFEHNFIKRVRSKQESKLKHKQSRQENISCLENSQFSDPLVSIQEGSMESFESPKPRH
jgi:serine/threonine protein kinase